MCGQVTDLHSGTFGGAVHNPLQALCEILARLHDARGRVAIPGFYDRVGGLMSRERRYMAEVGPSDGEVLADAGAADGWGEEGYTLYERTTIRPALTINGVTGGYQGPGAKGVIPAHASAKLNFRLVASQDPAEIDGLFRRFVARIAPHSVRVTVRTEMRAHPVSSISASGDARRCDRVPRGVRTRAGVPEGWRHHPRGPPPPTAAGHADRDDGSRCPTATGMPRTRSFICRPSFEAFARASSSWPSSRGEIAHDHRLPLSRGHGRRSHRSLGHGGAAGHAPAPRGAAGIERTVIFAAFHSNYASANQEVARMVASRPDRFYGFAFVHAARDRGRVLDLVRVAVQRVRIRGDQSPSI